MSGQDGLPDGTRCPGCQASLEEAGGGESLVRCPACSVLVVPVGLSAVTFATAASAADAAGPPSAAPSITLSPEFAARLRLTYVLGQGAMGIVYAGVEIATRRRVAVKFLARMASPDLLTRFVNEGRVLSAITHPRVLRVLSIGQTDGHPYLVTELLAGGTLRGRLERDRRLSPRVAAAVMVDALTGLAACHDAGVVHRDLKPDNILFDLGGVAKIADLGIAKSWDVPSVTATGAFIGTPLYMSPEQVKGEQATAASDLYAMGLIFYELVTGAHPFQSSSLPELLANQLTVPPPPLSSRAPEVPPALARLIHAMLAKEPCARPADARAVLAGILAIYPEHASRVPHDAPDAPAHEVTPERLRGDRESRPVVPARLVVELPIYQEFLLGARTRLGRDVAADIRFDEDAQVSKDHAEILLTEGGYVLIDQGSRNGSFVNEERVEGRMALFDGDLLRVGETRLKAVIPGGPARPVRSSPPGRTGKPAGASRPIAAAPGGPVLPLRERLSLLVAPSLIARALVIGLSVGQSLLISPALVGLLVAVIPGYLAVALLYGAAFRAAWPLVWALPALLGATLLSEVALAVVELPPEAGFLRLLPALGSAAWWLQGLTLASRPETGPAEARCGPVLTVAFGLAYLHGALMGVDVAFDREGAPAGTAPGALGIPYRVRSSVAPSSLPAAPSIPSRSPRPPARLDVSAWVVHQGATEVTLSGDSGRLATGGGDGTVRVWEVPSGQLVREFAGPGPVSRLSLSGQGERLGALFGPAGSVRVWSVTDGQPAPIPEFAGRIHGVDAEAMVAVGTSAQVCPRPHPAGSPAIAGRDTVVLPLAGAAPPVVIHRGAQSAAISPAGDVVSLIDGAAFTLQIPGGVAPAYHASLPVQAVAFGRTRVAVFLPDEVRILLARTGRQEQSIRVRSSGAVALAADDSVLALSAADPGALPQVRVTSLVTREKLLPIRIAAISLALSEDGSRLAVLDASGAVTRWRTESGEQLTSQR